MVRGGGRGEIEISELLLKSRAAVDSQTRMDVIVKQFATRCPTRPRFWSLVQNVHNVFVVLNVHSGTNFLEQNGFVVLHVQKKVFGELKCTMQSKYGASY